MSIWRDLHSLIYAFSIFPNPFTRTTNISFSVPANNRARLTIYNLSGGIVKQVDNLSNKDSPVKWNADNMPSGVFFVYLETVVGKQDAGAKESSPLKIEKKKVILIK